MIYLISHNQSDELKHKGFLESIFSKSMLNLSKTNLLQKKSFCCFTKQLILFVLVQNC